MTTSKSRSYIAMWDENGFEVLEDVSAWERQSLLDTIAGKQLKPAPLNLQALMLRARFNPQRNYEIYSLSVNDEVDDATLQEMATQQPQALVDLIRKLGNKLYSSGYNTKPVIQ